MIDVIQRLNEAAPQQARPKAVDNHATQAAVFFRRDESGQLLEPLGGGRLGVDTAQLGKDKSHLCELAGRLVAAVQFEAVVGKDGGERVGVFQLPIVHK